MREKKLFISKTDIMKNWIKKIIVSAALCFSVVGCGLFKCTPKEDNNVLGTQMINSYVMEATSWQVDSICTADKLPNIDTWQATSFTDFETGAVIVKRMYIKKDGKVEYMYIISGSEEPYSVTRRITR